MDQECCGADPVCDGCPSFGGVSVRGEEPEREPCKHDSTRLDCWLDTHCLLCGTSGYWIDGELIAASSVDAIAKGHVTRGHPGGKTLISQGAATA